MRIAVFCDVFPELSETFVRNEILAMRRHGHDVTVVAVAHARRPAPAEDVPVTYLCDIPRTHKLAALGALAVRHPVRCARDDRRSWRPADRPRHLGVLAVVARRLRGVDRIHAHFAAGAAVEALRVGRLLDVPVSVTAHAHDIFRNPRNLAAKLRRADLAITPCAYNARHLREVAGAPVHEIVMGVDVRKFRRTRPHPRAARVLAVGRLVEKKGFADLVAATALLRGVVERVTIVGAGPLELELRAQIRDLGLGDLVELAGPRSPAEIRALLEETAVLAAPCVVAADGDRDAMPVVVKEALAMEVPVVATDEVGLPELVGPDCGRLVAPHDPEALAGALAELLELPVAERAALGRVGRALVIDRCDVDVETGRLLGLMGASS